MLSPRIPLTTYRLQFNKQFRFADARALVPYLHRLGISDLYASPIFRARPGSWHGYDVTDPSRLNPELGTGAEFEALLEELQSRGMGLILDIVPNHMAASPDNPWWLDVLENGLCSPFASFFDIDWSPPDRTLRNRVLLPVLGAPYEEVLGNRELALTLEDKGLFVCYHDYRLPLDIKSCHLVFSYGLKEPGTSHPDFHQFSQLIDRLNRLPSAAAARPRRPAERYQPRQAIKEELLRLVNTSPRLKAFLLENIKHFNSEKGTNLLDGLLRQQVYRLAFWKTAREQINYRRFFNINDLIGVRVELPEVFEATHALVFQLAGGGKLTGLRIDHVDGLYDPLEYLRRLQPRLALRAEDGNSSPGFYIVVEKILSSEEALPAEWPVAGTVGYDFLNVLNALFVDSRGMPLLNETYSRLTGSNVIFDDIVYEKKRQVMAELFPGELNSIGHHLVRLAERDEHTAGLSQKELTKALVEVTACLPVYRTYIRTLEVAPQDGLYLEGVFQEAQRRHPSLKAALDFLRQVLLLEFPGELADEQKEAWLGLVRRWQQLTGAVMAKGFEDTALYNYHRLVSLNEVGGNPGSAGISVDEFHRRILDRQTRSPYTINATSTHDTKRSEDVRARINVLSEIPEEWEGCLVRWMKWNQSKKGSAGGWPVPEPKMEILFYQTLVGAWPLLKDEVADFKERLKAYMLKAAREAKDFTSWLKPNQEYEDSLVTFVESVLESDEFITDFLPFQERVAYYGALNALAQVLVKIAAPGVPDFYQGTELWDFSLVDPDNRRPVEFAWRIELLNGLLQPEAAGPLSLVRQVLESWKDGRVKLYVTCKALNLRRAHRDLFLDGDYIPLRVGEPRQENICAFARRQGETWVLVVVPRFLTRVIQAGELPSGRKVWGDSRLLLPEGAPGHWLNLFSGERLRVSGTERGLPLSDILSVFPVALLKSV